MTPGQCVCGYARVSTDEQGASGLSLQSQHEAIQAECAIRGWTLLRIDEDIASGGSMKRRPGLAAALASLEAGEANGLVTTKLDRLSRSLLDFANVLERAKREGWDVVVVEQGFDLNTPTGRAMAGMLAVFAQWEREIGGERTRSALAVARANGVRLGRPPALDVVVRERIVLARSEGLTLQRIADDLNGCDVPTAHGGARWYSSTIKAVLDGQP